MLKIYLALFFMLIFLPGNLMAAPQVATGVEEQLPALNLSHIQKFMDQLDSEVKRSLPESNFKSMVIKIAKGEFDWQPVEIFKSVMKYLFKEVVANASLLGKLVVLSVICAVLQNLTSAFEKETTGKLGYAVTYLAMVALALGSFNLAVNVGKEAVESMVTFMQALLPLLLTLVVAVGGVATAAVFHPLILIVLNTIGTLIKEIVFPLIFFSAVLGIISNLSDRFQLSNLAALLKSSALMLLGLFSTIFLGVLAVQGVASGISNGIALRTAKYATDSLIPVVGGMFSNALEAIIGSSLLIKNAVGLGGILIIFFLITLPSLKILSLAFIYRLAGALIQPIGDNQMVECLNGMGDSLIAIFAVVATVALLFFFSIVIVVGVGNLTVMLR